eukprot:scaffold10109_cov51-Attheya_sp.AAC.2
MSGGGGTYPPSSFHNNKGLQHPTIQPQPPHSHSQEQQNDGITLLGGRSEAKMGRFGMVAPCNDEQYDEIMAEGDNM